MNILNENICKILKQNIEVLNVSDKTIIYLRMQNYNRGLNFFKKTIDCVSLVIEGILYNQAYFNEHTTVVETGIINYMLERLLDAEKNRDYILLADLIEIQLNPFIRSLQEIIISKEEFCFDQELYRNNMELVKKNDPRLYQRLKRSSPPKRLIEEGYDLEYTSCGLMTLALTDGDKRYYLHGNGLIHHEAGILAREWFSEEKRNYIIYGLGLGYHVFELIDISESITISVYESDINIIQMAFACSDLEKVFSSDRVKLIYDPEFRELSSATSNIDMDTKYVIYYPSLRNINNVGIREQLDDYFVLYSSYNNQSYKMNSNFKINILKNDKYVDQIKDEFRGKDLYIIAAGPSLDKNINQLKDHKENALILSTGTVLKKLLNAGIKPDYTIIIDANIGVFKQTEGLTATDIPLLYLSTVYYKVPDQYPGQKYLICQRGFKKAEEYANERGYTLYQTGGSVSTTALELGINFGCKRIIFVGLDLAYTNDLDHALGTPSVQTIDSSEHRKVKDIYGNVVGTGRNLDIYRKWIEQRIENEVCIEFIDATEGGAKIKGMEVRKLSDC